MRAKQPGKVRKRRNIYEQIKRKKGIIQAAYANNMSKSLIKIKELELLALEDKAAKGIMY